MPIFVVASTLMCFGFDSSIISYAFRIEVLGQLSLISNLSVEDIELIDPSLKTFSIYAIYKYFLILMQRFILIIRYLIFNFWDGKC